jgi:hypothetical protein
VLLECSVNGPARASVGRGAAARPAVLRIVIGVVTSTVISMLLFLAVVLAYNLALTVIWTNSMGEAKTAVEPSPSPPLHLPYLLQYELRCPAGLVNASAPALPRRAPGANTGGARGYLCLGKVTGFTMFPRARAGSHHFRARATSTKSSVSLSKPRICLPQRSHTNHTIFSREQLERELRRFEHRERVPVGAGWLASSLGWRAQVSAAGAHHAVEHPALWAYFGVVAGTAVRVRRGTYL